MSSNYKCYLGLIKLLRELREDPNWTAVDERPLMGALEDIYWKLTDEEQDAIKTDIKTI